MNPIERRCVHCDVELMFTTYNGWLHKDRLKSKICDKEPIGMWLAEPEPDR